MNTYDYTHKTWNESEKFMNFVWCFPIEPKAKLLYLALCHFSRGQDHTFIDQQTLADVCCCSVRTVQRLLFKLEEAGLAHHVREGREYKYILVSSEEEQRGIPDKGRDGDDDDGDSQSPDGGKGTGVSLSPDKDKGTGVSLSCEGNEPDNLACMMPTGVSLSPDKDKGIGVSLSSYDNLTPVPPISGNARAKKKELNTKTPPYPPRKRWTPGLKGVGVFPLALSLGRKSKKTSNA
ncbi:MAG: helix-turn-helix domain-containing protein [Deltaproteobacteria bacterium]|jgi:hypothetical protein|nr:helix-turn-helix domain-containing protein [Deltaproteobacteria bacterium]